MAKSYEILRSLPATGPMYIPISNGITYISDFSEGFIVKFFKSGGDEWVGNFKLGLKQFSAVFELDKSNVLIIAGGAGYVMSAEQEVPLSFLNINYCNGFQTPDGRVILHNDIEITVIEPDGSFWISGRISIDGLTITTVEHNIIKGQYSDHNRNWGWFDFTLNIDTKETTGIQYNLDESPMQKKFWWKIW
ncbi:hypothetical protein HYN59_09345 [Flavobacterium album]|uniref:Uncharacterized protein n=1 Tax=Flavobacterium album TaxID=2175091 RepID=A0A2S1QY98_9FLAO|nr:hypothetical protein [Flavobacterium album]AWH85309.1 hypothetical protein HYN59_09345 [Flavobacterium album]